MADKFNFEEYSETAMFARLTADPEVRAAGSFQIITMRLVASTAGKKGDDGQYVKDTAPMYIDCEFWQRDKKGDFEFIQEHIKSGDKVFVKGRLVYETWDDKNSPGTKRSKHKLSGLLIKIIDKKGGGDSAPAQQQRGGYQAKTPAAGVDSTDHSEVPF